MEGIIVVNSYSAPGELQQQAEAILATMESHHMAHLGWVVAGDHNDLPDCSVLVQVLQAAHQAVVVGVGQGTRWQQDTPREIDFFIANRAATCTPAFCETARLSDHIGITTTCKAQGRPLQRGRLKPQPKWEQPSFVSTEEWKSLVRKAWFQCSHTPVSQYLQNLSDQPIDIEHEWKHYMSLLSEVVRLATRNAARHITSPAHHQPCT